MNKLAAVIIAGSVMLVSGLAMAGGCCGNSTIQQFDAYGPGQHMDQYGHNVAVQPMRGNSSLNTFNRIEQHNAYGPGIHMDQYGRAVTVEPQYGRTRSSISPMGNKIRNWFWRLDK